MLKLQVVDNNYLKLNSALPLYELDDVCLSFGSHAQDGLNNICLNIYPGEFVSILGPSGCGKSTLLRLLAGLLQPSSGYIAYDGSEVKKPVHSANLVFQNYALLPWLTVFNNIALGLGSKIVTPRELRQQVADVIEMIGLKGYENNYPGELSGGMCQRVGFARALVMQPEVLLLDEPFSALDCLTARKLRMDFLRLWSARKLKTKAVVMVTHNVEEAAEMSDRLIILGSKPGKVIDQIVIDRANFGASYLHELREEIYALLEIHS